MKSLSRIHTRTVVLGVCATAFAAGIITFRAQADPWDKRTTLTVNQPIQIRETVLEPGQYVLKLLNSDSDRHIVQIFNGDQSRIINTVMAIPKYRATPTGDTQFQFWETPPGTARAMRAWFYPGDTMGQEFPYPKQLTQIAMAQPQAAPLPVREPIAEPATVAPAPAETQTTTPEASTVTPAPQPEEPVQMAQNTPPPAQPTSASDANTAPAPTPSEPARELPKTASPYPLIGFAGLSMLGLYAALRLKRAA